MSGFTTSTTLKEMINKFPMRKKRRKRGNNALSYWTWNEKEKEKKEKS